MKSLSCNDSLLGNDTDRKNGAIFDRKGGASLARRGAGLRLGAHNERSRNACFFCVEPRLEPNCGVRSDYLAVAVGWRVPDASVVGRATAEELVLARLLSRQDDEYAQSRLFGEPLANWIRAWDSVNLKRAIGCSSGRSLRGGLEVPAVATPASGTVSPSCPQSRVKYVIARTGLLGRRIAENQAFSPSRGAARREPSQHREGTWRRPSSQRPLCGPNLFAFTRIEAD
jgi:hypothetical protein